MRQQYKLQSLIIFFYALSIILIVGVSSLIFSEYRSNLKDDSMEALKARSNQIARLFRDSLRTGDYFEVGKIADSLFDNGDYVSFKVENSYSETIYSRDNNHTGEVFNIVTKIGENDGKIELGFKATQIMKVVDQVSKMLLIFFLVVFSIMILFITFFTKFFYEKIQEITQRIPNVLNGETMTLNESRIVEFNMIEASLLNVFEKYLKMKKLEQQKEMVLLKEKVNKQVAHDIRSPLESLRSIVQFLDDQDEVAREIITKSIARISDIASGLLRPPKENKSKALVNMKILVEEIIEDKMFERKVEIDSTIKTSYGESFSLIHESDFYRATSNLINNAIEASEQNIEVALSSDDNKVSLSIKDKGQGMSSDFLEEVLKGGVTTKEKGNGIGLVSAKEHIEQMGGEFIIKSVVGEGTEIIMTFKQSKKPAWFSDDFTIMTKKVVCFDDDESFLGVYKERFKKYEFVFSSVVKEEIIKENSDAVFFFDNDLGGEVFGVDYISSYKLQEKSYLVTSMYQDKELQEKCLERNIKMIPKQIFSKIK